MSHANTTQLAQVQTNEQLHFNKPFILVTRVGNNDTNNAYHNPHQHYYEHDSMNQLFKHAARMGNDEKPISALRILDVPYNVDGNESGPRADYFHNFTTALDEYKDGYGNQWEIITSRYVEVNETDWCGEYKDKST